MKKYCKICEKEIVANENLCTKCKPYNSVLMRMGDTYCSESFLLKHGTEKSVINEMVQIGLLEARQEEGEMKYIKTNKGKNVW